MEINHINSYFDLKSIQEAKTPEEVAKNFQTIFLSMVVKEMRKTVPQFSSNDFGSRMYLDMFDMQLAQVMADSDQLGLKDYILNAIKSYAQNQDKKG
ncbi:rod-binding protein [Sulfurihydrogenibium subterraneum]|uniref:rod-binding protein n=1 Tax=Sulfurihydrogenibium subterraneum TaxID=171121 RepID=UPI00048D3665|nr:rod-binding protein [Sulfurihydrogenibium subterraneum]